MMGRRSSIVHPINVGRLLRTLIDLIARFGSVRCRFECSPHSTVPTVPSVGTFMESLAQYNVGGNWRDLQSFLARKGISPPCPADRRTKDLCKSNARNTGTLDRSHGRSNWTAHAYFGGQTRCWSASARQLDTPMTRF